MTYKTGQIPSVPPGGINIFETEGSETDEGKGKGLDTCCSDTYMSQTHVII